MIESKPDRLGHCTFLNCFQMDKVNKEKIPVEICPTSNLCCAKDALNMVCNLNHLKYLHGLEHNFTICTDDTMLFNTNLSTELFEYAKKNDVSSE